LIRRSKNYEICTHATLMARCIFTKKNSKNLKIVLDQVTLPKTGLVTPRTFNPLGVNSDQTKFFSLQYWSQLVNP
jgi:hypothetical protein